MLTNDAANRAGYGIMSSNHEVPTTNATPPNLLKVSTASVAAEKTISAAAEIAFPPPPPDPVGDAIKRCKTVANGGSVFKASNAQIFEGLKEAYPTYVLIKDNEAGHQRVIDELMSHGNRERKPSLRKAANNSTVLACHPDNPDEWTLCSDWSNVLVHADMEKVSPEDFPAWVQDKSIRVSKQKVRAAKKASKPLKTPFVVGDFPSLALVFEHCSDERIRQLMKEELTKLDGLVGKALAAPNLVAA